MYKYNLSKTFSAASMNPAPTVDGSDFITAHPTNPVALIKARKTFVPASLDEVRMTALTVAAETFLLINHEQRVAPQRNCPPVIYMSGKNPTAASIS